jgi:hypothetical protein
MTTGVACPGCSIHIVSDPGQQCYTCQLQADPGLRRGLWLRFLRVIDGGEITLADLYPEPERSAGREAGS